jgi:uncharacterized membrane protein
MVGFRSGLDGDIARWVGKGLIPADVGARLSDEAAEHRGHGTSFGSVLAIMASILVAASVLVFIAANWEAMPRTLRVTGLFVLIAASYVGGAILGQRGHKAFGEGLFVIGAAAFGGSIALIGQMYHMTGDELAAILTWCIGTIVAAAALRSPTLTVGAILIAVTWLVMHELEYSAREESRLVFPLLIAAIWAVSYWSRSRMARHFLLLSVILYVFLLGVDGNVVVTGAALAIVSALVFAAAHLAPDTVERFARLGGPYPALPLIGFLVGLAMIQFEIVDEFGPMLLMTLIAFAGIVAALLLRGRQSRLMRWIAYVAFTIEFCFAYIVTVGTMMDTAGLFLFSGIALALAAFFIIRIEKRMAINPTATGVAA